MRVAALVQIHKLASPESLRLSRCVWEKFCEDCADAHNKILSWQCNRVCRRAGPCPVKSLMTRRSRAREVVLQMLFQQDFNNDVPPTTVLEQMQERLEDEVLSRFAWQLFAGVNEFRPALDARLEAIAANWSLKRMAPTDRNVLRLGAYELMHTDTPARVIVDEALELAKKFGSNQSAQFVNGILDRLMPASARNAPRSPEAEPAS